MIPLTNIWLFHKTLRRIETMFFFLTNRKLFTNFYPNEGDTFENNYCILFITSMLFYFDQHRMTKCLKYLSSTSKNLEAFQKFLVFLISQTKLDLYATFK